MIPCVFCAISCYHRCVVQYPLEELCILAGIAAGTALRVGIYGAGPLKDGEVAREDKVIKKMEAMQRSFADYVRLSTIEQNE